MSLNNGTTLSRFNADGAILLAQERCLRRSTRSRVVSLPTTQPSQSRRRKTPRLHPKVCGRQHTSFVQALSCLLFVESSKPFASNRVAPIIRSYPQKKTGITKRGCMVSGTRDIKLTTARSHRGTLQPPKPLTFSNSRE